MIKKIIALIVFMVWGSVVNAVIIDHGRYLTDTQSGLDWLDVTSTVNMTPDQVNAELIPGGNYYGWRYATDIEFSNLLYNYTGVVPALSGHFIQEPDRIDGLIELLGDTINEYYMHFEGKSYGDLSGLGEGIYGGTIGFLIGSTRDPRYWMSMIIDIDEFPDYLDFSEINFRVDNWPTGFYDVGSFLIRDSSINIPEPPPFVLMAFFLLLLMIKTRHN